MTPFARSATGMAIAGGAICGILALQSAFSLSEPSSKATESAKPPAPTAPSEEESNADFVVAFGYIDIEGGTTPLNFLVSGQVEDVLVKENESVKAGQPLAKLRSVAAKHKLDLAAIQLDDAKIKVEKAELGDRQHKLLFQQQEEAIDVAQSRASAQRRQVEQTKSLADAAAVSKDNYLSANDQLLALEGNLKVERLRLEQLRLNEPKLLLKHAAIGVASAEAELSLSKELLDQHVLSAPVAGQILRIGISKGQLVGPTSPTPAFWFCPASPKLIRAEVQQRFANRVAENQFVRIHDDSSGTLLGTGKISRAANWIAHRRSLLDEPLQRNDVRTLECQIVLDPANLKKPAHLWRLGERVRVVIETPPRPAGS